MERDETLPALGWQETETGLQQLAVGAVVAAEVKALSVKAVCVEHLHAGGKTVMHHWLPEGETKPQPSVVLFHGGSGSWTHWVRNIDALTKAGLDVWAVDLPGFGGSDGLPDVSDADGMLEALAQLLAVQFSGQPVQLVGFSFGAMTAGLLAEAFPHLVSQLVLVGAPGFGLNAKPSYRLKGWRHLASPYSQLQRHVFNLGALMLYKSSEISRDTVALHVANVQKDRLPRRKISRTDVLINALSHVCCPVNVIYGEFDVLYPDLLDSVESLLRTRVSNFQNMYRIPNAGHWVQYENADAFDALLLPILLK